MKKKNVLKIKLTFDYWFTSVPLVTIMLETCNLTALDTLKNMTNLRSLM